MTFLGFAPNVTNGYFVMRADNRIELTSNIADEPVLDATSEPVEQPPRTSTEEPPQLIHDYPYTDKELEAIMGPEGGGGWYWIDDRNKELTTGPQDDPMEVVSAVRLEKSQIIYGSKKTSNRRRFQKDFNNKLKNLER